LSSPQRDRDSATTDSSVQGRLVNVAKGRAGDDSLPDHRSRRLGYSFVMTLDSLDVLEDLTRPGLSLGDSSLRAEA
jgi:hypothetical protein